MEKGEGGVSWERKTFGFLLFFISRKVCARIAEEGYEEKEAIERLYRSQLRAALERDDTGLWKLDEQDLYDLYREEQEKGSAGLEAAAGRAASEDTVEGRMAWMARDYKDCREFRKREEHRLSDEAGYALLVIEDYREYRDLTGKECMDILAPNGMIEYLFVAADVMFVLGEDFAMKFLDGELEEKGVKFDCPGTPFKR